MRSAIAIIPLFALMRLGLADLDWSDVPNTCRNECQPVMNIFTDCARELGQDTSVDFFRNGTLDFDRNPQREQRYVDCVCNKPNASADIPNCSNCLIRNGYRDKEVGDFVRACRFAGATGVAPNNTASPTATLATGTGVNNNQPAQATGAASKVGAQNVLVAAALVGLPVAFL